MAEQPIRSKVGDVVVSTPVRTTAQVASLMPVVPIPSQG